MRRAQALDSFALDDTPFDAEGVSADGQQMGNAENEEWKKVGGRREARTRDLRVANEPARSVKFLIPNVQLVGRCDLCDNAPSRMKAHQNA
jgi:hypothetical protein